MAKKTKDAKTSKRRTQVKNLSKSAKNLNTAEAKNVKGGKAQLQDFHRAAGAGAGGGKVSMDD